MSFLAFFEELLVKARTTKQVKQSKIINMSDEVSSSIKLPTFDGKEENFSMWWTRFQAFAMVKNFSEALELDPDLPSSKTAADALDATKATNKPALKAVKRNNVAMAQFTMAFETQGLLTMIDACKSISWPGGNPYILVTVMKNEYQPSYRISAVQLKQKLKKIELGEHEDPKVLFEKIAAVKNEYRGTGSNLSVEDMLTIVLE